VCEQNNMLANCWREIDLVSILANMLLCRSHIPILVCQQELANTSLTCEGRLKKVLTVVPMTCIFVDYIKANLRVFQLNDY